MTTPEHGADYRIISKGIIKFSEIEIAVPMTLTAIDATTHKPTNFTVLPIGKYERSFTTVVFRYLGGDNFHFNLFGAENQPYSINDGTEMAATSSGHLVDKLDLNHYDRDAIHIGEYLDLGFEFYDGDEVHHLVAHDVSSISFGERINLDEIKPADLEKFFQELETARRK